MESEIGVVHGRFQPFHLDHLRYCLAAKEHCEYLIVGITNPDPILTKADEADTHRSLRSANPLSYYERLVIIRESLLEAKVMHDSFYIVPFPINRPELIKFYVPQHATFYITIYDEWGRKKYNLLKSLGAEVVVLWEKSLEEKAVSGSDVRNRIANGSPWEHLVPNAASQVIKNLGLETRIKQSYTSDDSFSC
jgi:cytidyltransferase-like protein